MTPRDFCFWLQGHFEMADCPGATNQLTAAQTLMVRDHLKLVFDTMTTQPVQAPSIPSSPSLDELLRDPKRTLIC